MSRLLIGASARQRNATPGDAAATLYLGRVAASSDDAEETEFGSIFLTSTDLELAMDDAEGESVVGLRFSDVQLPRGGAINEAYLQLTAQAFGGAEMAVDIRAQASDNAPTFTETEGDLVGRVLTTAAVNWPIPAWAAEQVDEDTTSPNLAAIISEVTNRPGWSPGNSIALIITRATGAAARAAHSFDSDPAKAPQLFINQAPAFEGDASGAGGSVITPTSAFSLLADTTFDPEAPVIRGTALTGDALETWQGIKWLIADHETRRYSISPDSGILNELADKGNLYHYGRDLAEIVGQLAVLFRLTGWLDVLDEWVRLADRQYALLTDNYEAPLGDLTRWPTHPYRRWNWTLSGSREYTGSDYHPLDNIRAHAPILHLLYALRLNEGVLGGGFDYGAKADMWQAYIEDDWIPAWQGPEGAVGYSDLAKTPASGWAANYRGNLLIDYRDLAGARAGAGLYPIQSRHHAHTHVGASNAHVWLGKAIPAHADATAIGLGGITDMVMQRNLFYYTGKYGENVVWPRSLHDVGNAPTIASPGPGNYVQPSTYLGIFSIDMLNMWLEGLLPDFVENFAQPTVNTWNEHMFSGFTVNQDGSTPVSTEGYFGVGMQADMLANGSLLGSAMPTRRDGAQLPFETSVGNSGNSNGYPRNNAQLVSSSLTAMMPWDVASGPDANFMENHVWSRMAESSLFTSATSDPKSMPRVLGPSLGLLLKQLGAKDWTL